MKLIVIIAIIWYVMRGSWKIIIIISSILFFSFQEYMQSISYLIYAWKWFFTGKHFGEVLKNKKNVEVQMFISYREK